MPTLKAYEILREVDVVAPIRLYKNDRDTMLHVLSVEILDVLSPEGGRAILKIWGSINRTLEPGDRISLGPTPFLNIRIEGEVIYVDKLSNQVSIRITRMASIPQVRVGEVATQNMITVTPQDTIIKAASLMESFNIRGLPVIENEKLVGIITQTDILRAVKDDKINGLVRDYMTSPPVTIRHDDTLFDAIKTMEKYNVGRLLVTNERGKLIGIVTKTDILRFIAGIKRK